MGFRLIKALSVILCYYALLNQNEFLQHLTKVAPQKKETSMETEGT